jgi:putative DNA primase/helicase
MPLQASVNNAPLRHAALAYAELGWRVFPVWGVVQKNGEWVCECGDPHLGDAARNVGKHPRIKNWQTEATDDYSQVDAWWRKWPHSNIGLVCGVQSGVWALDVDVGRAGPDALGMLEAQHGDLPTTLKNRTATGGWHLVWRWPEGNEGVGNSSDRFATGLDVRGERGYVILPPSRGRNGERYQWEYLVDPEPAPAWLVELTRAPVPQGGAGAGRSPNVWRGGEVREGRRNTVMFATLCSMLGRGLLEEDIRANAYTLNQNWWRPALDEEELEKILASVLHPNREGQKPRTEGEFADWLAAKVLRGTWVWGVSGKFGAWYRYSGLCWEEGDQWAVQQEIWAALAYWKRQAEKNNDEEDLKWARGAQKTRFVEAVERALRAKLRDGVERFSSEHNRHLLALADGNTLVLGRDGSVECRASSAGDWLRGVVPLRWEPGAECKTWDNALKVWMEGDEARIAALWRWMGSLLTGEIPFEKFFLAVGDTRSGKSTFAGALQRVLGDLSVTLPTGLVIHSRGLRALSSSHKEASKAQLFGKRLGVFAETTAAAELDAEALKSITGANDRIHAKLLYSNPSSFVATHKLFLHTNHYPEDRGLDEAVLERLAIFVWCKTIEEKDRDPYLAEKLYAERNGWLQRAVRGYQDLMENGLGLPESVTEEVEEYRERVDTFGPWLEFYCETEPGNPQWRTAQAELWGSYEELGKRQKAPYLGRNDFYKMLERKGFRRLKFHGERLFEGIKLRDVGQKTEGNVLETRI